MFTKEDVISSFFKNLNINPKTIAKRAYQNSPAILFEELIDTIYICEGKVEKICSILRINKNTYYDNMKRLFPERAVKTWKAFIFFHSDYKYCPKCDTIKLKSDFPSNRSTADELAEYCKPCRKEVKHEHYINNKSSYIATATTRKLSLINRTPPWANLKLIKQFYKECPKGYHVDHIIPLNGYNVCGLHVIDNLQYLTAEQNLSKGNKWNP